MPDSLDFQPIPGLPGWRSAHVAVTGSTNADLAALVAGGAAGDGRLWLTAGEQRTGRGRRGRGWSSPPGNLFASVVLVDPAPAEQIGALPLVAGLAMRNAIATELGSGAPAVQLKWPNDVLIDGAKCCGILLERTAAPDGRTAVIVGFGGNIVAHPLDTPYPATHLREHRAAASAATLFHRLAESFAHMLAVFDRGRGLGEICERWRSHARGIGQDLIVNLERQSFRGVFQDIDADGRLILRLPDGAHRRFAAGDVFF